MRWKEFEDEQLKAQMPRNVELISCPRCGGTWLYQVNVNQFSNQQVTILQEPVTVHPNNVPLLVCAKCGQGVRHNVAYFQMTRERRIYDQMIKETMSEEAQEQVAVVLKSILGTKDGVPEGKEIIDGDVRDEIPSDGQDEVPTAGDE
jgi:Zn-finger nucleic acid-binding protein